LKQRSLLDSTLIIWGGEFGRKPVRDRNGNDNSWPRPQRESIHDHPGRRRGPPRTVYGATDDSAPRRRKTRYTSTTLHVTILALLGFDHEKRVSVRHGARFQADGRGGAGVKSGDDIDEGGELS